MVSAGVQSNMPILLAVVDTYSEVICDQLALQSDAKPMKMAP